MSKKPVRFEDLGVKELRRSAIEDFAVEVDAKDDSETVIAALVESGVTWDQYVAQHPEVAPEPEKAPENVIKSPEPTNKESLSVGGSVKTAKPEVAAAGDYLIKMDRENLMYQTRGYTFTKDHPYVVVKAEDAQWILSKEDGFRMAWPNELSDYYDKP